VTIRRLPLFLPAIAAVVLAAGCGGGGSSSGTMDPTEWADSLCGSIDTWATSVRSTTSTLRGGNVSKDSLQSAAGDIKDSTTTLADDLKGLGKPDTDAGDQAKQAVDKLSSEYKDETKAMEDTVKSASGATGAAQAASAVRSTLTTMSSQLQAMFAGLQKRDAKGELEKAFKNASSCKALSNQGG
jgi:argininosuccinate lyase